MFAFFVFVVIVAGFALCHSCVWRGCCCFLLLFGATCSCLMSIVVFLVFLLVFGLFVVGRVCVGVGVVVGCVASVFWFSVVCCSVLVGYCFLLFVFGLFCGCSCF